MVILRIDRERTPREYPEKGKLEATNVSPKRFKGTSPGQEGESRSCPSLHSCKQGDVIAFQVVCIPGGILVQQLQRKDQQNGMTSGEWLLPLS